MNKLYLLVITMMFGGVCSVQAQSNDDNEITVTDAQGKNEVIELPEAMTQELDSLLHLYHSKAYLKADTSCNMPDVNPMYDRKVYKERLSKLPTIIEMPYNDVVQKFIDRYSGHLRRSVAFMLGAQNFYMPIFEQALESYGLPLELKYLPVIESALNPLAVSRVGATGLWQFMLRTAKRYDLEVNSLVDERRDPVKSSYAAARYLKDLYNIYGDWNLVIAAYNCGPDKINKAIHRAKQNDYWQIYPYLPQETRGYVPAFIAANYIMNYYCDHNICPMTTDLPGKTDTVMVDRDIHFEQLSHVLGISIDQIRELNPQYRRNIINGSNGSTALRLPSAKITEFIDNEKAVYAYESDELTTKRKEVVVNDDVPTYQSSRNYSRHSSSSSRRHRRERRSRGRSITIRQGDTLSEIAARNGTTVKKLKKLNKISGNSIRAGKKIKVK
uniref:Lytic transglycosylase domain-containing protein n=1 Tax=Prevotella sp. GTC17254 TaxID=3236794 RepID=A0AB33IYA6_9BACT